MFYSALTKCRVVCGIALLLTSCGHVGNLAISDKSNLIAPDKWQNSTSVTTDISPPAFPNDYWGIELNNRVKTMLAKGLQDNQQLKIAQLRIQQSAAEYRNTQGQALPTLKLKASQRVYQTLDDDNAKHTQNNTTIGLLASWEVDVWSRLADESKSDLYSHQSQIFNLAAAQLSIKAQLLTTWLKWLEQVSLLKLNSQHEINLKHRLDMSLMRLDHGLASSLDVRNAQTSLYRLNASSEALRLKRDTTERELKTLMGEYPNTGSLLDDNLPSLGTLPVVKNPHSILLHRPDILAAEANLLASGYQWQATEKRKLPSLSIDYTFDVKSSYAPKLFDLDFWLHSITASLVQPIFYKDQLSAQADKSKAQHQIALHQYQTVLLNAWQEVENNLHNELSFAQQYQALDKALVQAKAAELQTESHYSQGLSSSFDLLSAQRTRYSIEADQIKMHISRIKNRIQLSMSLGLPKHDLPQVP